MGRLVLGSMLGSASAWLFGGITLRAAPAGVRDVLVRDVEGPRPLKAAVRCPSVRGALLLPSSNTSDRLADLRVLRAQLEAAPSVYADWSVEEVEQVLQQVAHDGTLVMTDCSELPCLAGYRGLGIDTLTERVHGQVGFENAAVGGSERAGKGDESGVTVVVLWEAEPTEEERMNARTRLNVMMDQLTPPPVDAGSIPGGAP